jgi:hypothetical protein
VQPLDPQELRIGVEKRLNALQVDRKLRMEVMTIVEGRVPPTKAAEFESAYSEIRNAPPTAFPKGWKMSYLIRDRNDQELYRIMTIWESIELLEAYQRSVQTPTARALFKKVGVEPQLQVFDVIIRLSSQTNGCLPS